MFSLERLIVTYVDNVDDYILVKLLLFCTCMWLCSRTTIRLCIVLRVPSWSSGCLSYVLCKYVAGLIQAGSFLPLGSCVISW